MQFYPEFNTCKCEGNNAKELISQFISIELGLFQTRPNVLIIPC